MGATKTVTTEHCSVKVERQNLRVERYGKEQNTSGPAAFGGKLVPL
jgi:gamma-glutamylcysteine synthetase